MWPSMKLVKAYRSDGYSLLELLLVIVIVGLVFVPLYVLYEQQRRQIALDTTKNNIAAISKRLAEYKFRIGDYPCPAPLDAARGDPRYGVETDCFDTSVPPGACNPTAGQLYCVQQAFVPTILDCAMPVPNPTDRRVRRGAIPFISLGIDESLAYDGYGNKITYVMTEALGRGRPNFCFSSGGIMVFHYDHSLGGDIAALDLGVNRLAQVLLVSHGADENGAYNSRGVQVRPCDAGEIDEWNCWNDPTANYRTATISTSGAGSGNQMDDIVEYFPASDKTDPWQISINNSGDIHPVTSGGEGVGIGTSAVGLTTFSPIASIDINSGNLLATDDPSTAAIEGRLMVNDDTQPDVRPTGGTDGLKPIAISGNNALPGEGMICPSGEFATGISNNQVVCDIPKVQCGPGTGIKKINADGIVECSGVCPALNVDLCGDGNFVYTLPAQDRGFTQAAIDQGGVAPDNFRREIGYRCGNANVWEIVPPGQPGFLNQGVCACTSGTTTGTAGCPGAPASPCSGEAPWIGSATTSTTTTCPLGTITTTVSTTSCTCNPYTACRNRPCPAGPGTFLETQTFTCLGGSHSSTSSWTPDSATFSMCTCPGPVTNHIDCQPFEIGGGFDYILTTNCSTGVVTQGPNIPVGTPPGCTCNNGFTRTVPETCPTGTVSDAADPRVKDQSYDCSLGTYVDVAGSARGTCAPIVSPFNWLSVFPTGTSSPFCSPGRPKVGDSCLPADFGKTTLCCQLVGTNFETHSCRCQ